ncbi:histone acetyltransferase HPA2 and related acetyltransferases [Vibrio maritimus]|uniref:Histone acetyltransferase HPA2 and related acetyltransferases n=1 Tax=Vibrio maritimus TaxID=990268 RepID=A0A090T2X4_9VIBR|nr:histone acetyltransferase HPA2 and related acetyltransferases [Vibrio maritimus]
MPYSVSTDKQRLDMTLIHRYLSNSYWAKGVPLSVVEKSIEHSLCFGAYDSDGNQVGFARIITDRATFAYLSDVFVVDDKQGQGIAKLILSTIEQHPDLQGLRRTMLGTVDAHSLYQKFGFKSIQQPEFLMQKKGIEAYV